MKKRTEQEWLELCEKKITNGYTPGGDKKKTFTTGVVTAGFLVKNNLLYDGLRVLDVGCGNGRLAMGILQLGIKVDYFGVDVIPGCIDFCNHAFDGYDSFSFSHIDVQNDRYNPRGNIDQGAVVYQFDDMYFDLVAAFSVFSHTGTVDTARKTLIEMKRVLQPAGRVFSTWSLTTLLKNLSGSHKHTVYNLADAVRIHTEIFRVFEFVALDKFGQDNQIGIISTVGT